jgi:ABC-type glycerol-3-phosphate transport system permease component
MKHELLIQPHAVAVASLTAGDWIAIVVLVLVTVLLLAPVVWLAWLFLRTSDDDFYKSVDEVQEFVDLTAQARAEAKSFTGGSLLDGDPHAAVAAIDKFMSRKALARQAVWPRGYVLHRHDSTR